ncbi:MAG: TIGR04086 family membrane protein, partial [Lachnospiraceae bacterium]|nr:TIGR04086 family membrane protein [Lachnospiraceae bacterium]
LGVMLLLSCLLLGILSALVWKLDGNEKLVSGGIIAIYIITTFVGGFVMGNLFGKQKFFWGFLIGFLFFSVLLFAGTFLAGTELSGNGRVFPGFMICSVAGMFGGMLSPGKKKGEIL